MILASKRKSLEQAVKHAAARHPTLFDDRVVEGMHFLFSHQKFLEHRSVSHLQKILFALFALKHKKKTAPPEEKQLFVRIFCISSRICIAILRTAPESTAPITEAEIIRAAQNFVMGGTAVRSSFLSWLWSTEPTLFSYMEIDKPRGENLQRSEIKMLERNLQDYLRREAVIVSPTIFCPLNYEDIYRQLLALYKEIRSMDDLPHVSIRFKGQNYSDLEFLVYIIRPEPEQPLERSISWLPAFMRYSPHVYSVFKTALPCEAAAFSLHIPICCLVGDKPTNLLAARKYVSALIEKIIGSFRDCNGGMFIQQGGIFDAISDALKHKIPRFDDFAEVLFYGLKPLEAQLSLKLSQAEALFSALSETLRQKNSFLAHHSDRGVLVIKTKDETLFARLLKKAEQLPSAIYSSLSFDHFWYLLLLDPSSIQTSSLAKELKEIERKNRKKTLSLAFQEGMPPSFNPRHIACDGRCQTVFKALYEGLTRMDERGEPALANAEKIDISEDGKRYTFTLRSTHWSNGEPVTAMHYVQSWKEVFFLSDQVDLRGLRSIKNGAKILQKRASPDSLAVEAKDSHTLCVELEAPDPCFLLNLAQPLFFPVYDLRKEPYVTNGPYFLRSKTLSMLTLHKNPHFWDAEKVGFDAVEIAMIPDSDSGFELYKQQRIDWVGGWLCAIPLDKAALLRKKNLLKNNPLSTSILVIHLNVHHPLLKSAKIRRALSLAIDRDEFHRSCLVGSLPFALCPLGGSANIPQFDAKLARTLFQQGLEESGWTQAQFPKLVLRHADHVYSSRAVKAIRNMWEKTLGISVELVSSDWNTFRGDLEKGEFQAGCCYEVPHYPDPLNLLDRFDSDGKNYGRWKDPAFDRKLALVKSAKTPEERAERAKSAEALLLEAAPIIVISHDPHVFAESPDLQGGVVDYAGNLDIRWCSYVS